MPVTASHEVHNDPTQPDYWHPHYKQVYYTLEYVKDMYYGRRRWINDRGDILDTVKAHYYLPKAEAQKDDQYVKQVRSSIFRRFFREAIEKDFASMLVDFQLTQQASEFEQYFEDVDLLGNSLRVFVKKMVAMALRDGSSFCLVDMPKEDEGVVTLADARESERRPYFVFYERSQVVNWRTVNTDYGPVLDMVVLREEITKQEGEFGHEQYERYRVIRANGTYEVYEAKSAIYDNIFNPRAEATNVVLERVDSGTFDAEGIPLVGLSLTSSDPFTADFPLIEMADLTLDYYRVRSGYRTTLDYMEPTLHVNEMQDFAMNESSGDKQVKVGANAVIWNMDTVEWVEPVGGGISPKERCLKEIEKQIDEMTVAFFTGGHVMRTATEARLDAAQSEATLGDYAYHLESVVREMFRHFAAYNGTDPAAAGGIAVNKALLKPLAAWTPRDILDWISEGAMRQELGYRIMHELNLLPEGITLDEISQEVEWVEQNQSLRYERQAEMPTVETNVDDTEDDDGEDPEEV